MHSLCCSKCGGSYICFTVGWQHSALHTNRNSWAAMLGNRLIRSESNSGSCACANPNWHVHSSLSLSLSLTLWRMPFDCLMRLSAARAALALSTSCEISANCSRLQADASMDRAPPLSSNWQLRLRNEVSWKGESSQVEKKLPEWKHSLLFTLNWSRI